MKIIVGVRDLKARLSQHLKEVTQGEVIEVTSRGEAIARILPSTGSRKSTPMDLVAEGIANWNGKKPRVKKPKWTLKGRQLASDLLLENRD